MHSTFVQVLRMRVEAGECLRLLRHVLCMRPVRACARYRPLDRPDGISGQVIADDDLIRCPNWAELGIFEDNVAHSTGVHGLKISNYFPVIDGYLCPIYDALPSPATFKNFTSFKNRHMGVWGEMMVDVNFDSIKTAEHYKAGMEFKYMNGRDSHFATSMITNALFVGNFDKADIMTPEGDKCRVRKNCMGPRPVGNASRGFFYPTPSSMGNGWPHGIHLPGIGSEVEVHNSSFHNYQGAVFGCAWCVAHRGGYEMEFWNVSFTNVEHVAHFKHGVGGILVDGDGSLGTGTAGGAVVPPTGQWRTNNKCVSHESGRFTLCKGAVRRVNVEVNKWTSPWWNTPGKKKYPLITVTDVTNENMTIGWDKWRRCVFFYIRESTEILIPSLEVCTCFMTST